MNLKIRQIFNEKRIKLKIRKILFSLGLVKIKKKSNSVKWGVIGLGNMADVMSTTIDWSYDSIITAVASRSTQKAKQFASKHGNCLFYGSYQEMINDANINLDVIYIATPVKYHFSIIKQCLIKGKNVVCEKSITSNASEFKELVEIAKKNNCFLMEAMWMKCLPAFVKAHSWIKKGYIGDVELVKADFYKRQKINEELSVFNSKEGGGVLMDFGIYSIAFMISFLNGKPDNLNFTKRLSTIGIDTDWSIQASKGSVNVTLNISSNFNSKSKASIIGNNGYIEFDSQFNRTDRICVYDKFGNFVEEFRCSYKFDGFEYQVSEVNNCITNGNSESHLISLQHTLQTLEILDLLKN